MNDIDRCRPRFDNKLNFNGFPERPLDESKRISDSYPMMSIAKAYALPYWVALNIGDAMLETHQSATMFKHPADKTYWRAKALAELTRIVGAYDPAPSMPEESKTIARAMIYKEVLEVINEHIRKHRLVV